MRFLVYADAYTDRDPGRLTGIGGETLTGVAEVFAGKPLRE